MNKESQEGQSQTPKAFRERQKVEIPEAERQALLERFVSAPASEKNTMIGSEVYRILDHRFQSDWQEGGNTEYQSPILERLGVYNGKYGNYDVPFLARLEWNSVGRPNSGDFKFNLGRAQISNQPRPTPPAFGANISYELGYLNDGPIQWAKRRGEPIEQEVSSVQKKEISVDQQRDAIVFNGIGFALEALRQPEYTEVGPEMLEGLASHFEDLIQRNQALVEKVRSELKQISDKLRARPDKKEKGWEGYHVKQADRIDAIIKKFEPQEQKAGGK